ncbi:hypothetical protein B0H13DRAFT_745164 [Mycena leptocephala]|nr:hypothetical protein B0H13DRAFT_745164 [Mycena leptocephala]
MQLSAFQKPRPRRNCVPISFLLSLSPVNNVASTSPARMPVLDCHLSSKLFPRGANDRIILPAIRPGPGSSGQEQAQHSSKSPFSMGTDRSQFAPPRPQSTAPHEYRPRRQEPPPPVPALPRGYGEPSSSTSRGSLDTQRAPPPMHRPVPMHAHAQPTPERSYTFAPPDRPRARWPRHIVRICSNRGRGRATSSGCRRGSSG